MQSKKKRVILSTENLVKHYKIGKQRVLALNGVSLEIYQGEILALTGASGSGKSTLLSLIGGLDKPTSGKVIVNGTDINRLRSGELARFRGQTIGFVFQFFYLQPFLNVRRNTEVPGMFAKLSKRRERREQAQKILHSVGLDEQINQLPKTLSGGQIQRVAIARALLNNPKILLADEPTGNLDSVNSAAIIDLLEEIRRTLGTTIIIVTHNPKIAARADREIKLSDGRIV